VKALMIALALLAGGCAANTKLLCFIVERPADSEKFMYCRPTTLEIADP
jgi:hypothetical protein